MTRPTRRFSPAPAQRYWAIYAEDILWGAREVLGWLTDPDPNGWGSTTRVVAGALDPYTGTVEPVDAWEGFAGVLEHHGQPASKDIPQWLRERVSKARSRRIDQELRRITQSATRPNPEKG